jgi:hypothetical protein
MSGEEAVFYITVFLLMLLILGACMLVGRFIGAGTDKDRDE